MWSALFDRTWKRLLWFAFIPALTYLPSAFRLTYYRDDWYYAYDALVGPAGIFRALFAIDRPARGPFFELYHLLFGMAPLPYHLAMFAWRLAGGLATAWLFSMLWPRRRWAGWAAGLLFAMYPGFTWWVSSIEYQPMVASAALMVLSLGLTVQATRLERPLTRWACVLGAIVTGWLYLALVEYAAGMEIFRLCLLYMIVRTAQTRGLAQRLRLALGHWLPYLIIPAGFTVWRFVLFTSQRKATDLGAQLGSFLAEPLTTGLRWSVNFLLSFINVVFSAWVVPLMSGLFSNPLREVLLALMLALAAAAAGWFLLRGPTTSPAQGATADDATGPTQMLWLGLAGLVLGIVPIIVANRQITLPNFSHYALPGSLGAAFLFTGLASGLSSPGLRTSFLSVMVLLCAMTHQGLGLSAAHEERIIAGFWRQMAWRAPSIAGGTTLLAYYPNLDYADDTDVVWGPANYVYHPERQQGIPVQVPVSALVPGASAVNDILLGRDPQTSAYRAHTMMMNYDAVVILSQSSENSCVHALDPRWPTLSVADDPALRLLASHSHPEHLGASGNAPALPTPLFGSEPRHGWCFYFEQASLASQQGKWSDVAALQDSAAKLALHPNDQVEWMPFLQAQAYLGNLQQVRELATRINTEKLYKQQACEHLRAMPRYGYPLAPATVTLVDSLFCGGKP